MLSTNQLKSRYGHSLISESTFDNSWLWATFIYSKQVSTHCPVDYESKNQSFDAKKIQFHCIALIQADIYRFAAISAFCDRCRYLWSNDSAWGTKRTVRIDE